MLSWQYSKSRHSEELLHAVKLNINVVKYLQCNGKILRGYPSLSEAKIGCKNNSNCSGVFDVDCDDYLFWSCEGKIESIDSTLSNELDKTLCLWERGTTSILAMIMRLKKHQILKIWF